MALQKNIISVPIFGGVDTKTDEKLLPNGSLRKLVNGVFNKTGRISKRNGYKKITDNTNDKADLQGLWESDDKLIYRDGKNFKTKDGSVIGIASSVNATVDLLGEYGKDFPPNNNLVTYTRTFCKYENFEIYEIYGEGFVIKKDGYVLSRIGYITGNIATTQIHATALGFTILYKDYQNDLYSRFYKFSNNTLSAPSLIKAGIGNFDACFVNNTTFILYTATGPIPGVKTTYLSALDMSGDPSLTYSTVDTGVEPFNQYDPIRICGELLYGQVNLLTSVLTSSVLIKNIFWLNVVPSYDYTIDLMLEIGETNARVMNFITDLNNSIATHMVSRSTELPPGSSVLSNYEWIQNLNTFTNERKNNFARGLVPAGRSFRVDGRTYFPMAYIYAEAPSFDYPISGYEYGKLTNQPSLFFYDAVDLKVIGRTLSQNIQDTCTMSSIFVKDNTAYFGAISDNNICSLMVQVNNEVKGIIKNGQNLILNTGNLMNFDSFSVFNQGFYTFPEIKSVSPFSLAGPGGPIMSTGDKVSYQAVFSFKDAYGKIYESSTSIPVQYTLDVPGIVSTPIEINVRVYFDSFNKPVGTNNTIGSLMVDLYRTEVNGSVFYKCKTEKVRSSEFIGPAWIIQDDMSDSVLIENPPIYTTGGILDNETPDNIEGLTSFASRTIVWSGNTIYFSKQYIDGDPIYFNVNSLYVKVPESLGKIKSLAYIDDSLAIFTDIGIYVLTGTPPDNAGLNGALSNFSIISKEMGAVDSQNLITSIGVFFKCPRGLYLLPRGFGAIQYIGAPVEEYNQFKINTMFISQKDTSFYFLLDNKTTLVYNSLYTFWSVFDTFDNRGGCMYKDLVNLLDKDGNILEEAPGTWTHDTKPIKLTIGTQWIKLNGIQGYQRVWRMLLLGNYKSPHQMRVEMAYDYLPYNDPRSTRIMDSTAQYQHLYGQGGLNYGQGGYALGGPLQWDISPAWQKCEAISFEISDLQDPAGGYGPSFELNDLTIEAGVKAGPMRLPKGKKG